MFKICSTCNKEKLTAAFRKDKSQKDGLQPRCKQCARHAINANYKKYRTKTLKRNKERQDKTKYIIRKYREDHVCELCGESESVCLEFHHLDPSTKSFGLSHVTTQSDEAINEEIQKCILICSNCHKKVHAGIILLI